MTSPTEMTPTNCSSRQDRDLRDMPLAHLAHDVVDLVLEPAGDGVAGHDVGDPQPAKSLAAVMDQTQHIALAEDTDQLPAGSTTGSDPMLF